MTSLPTCTTVGTKKYKCKTCGNVANTTTIPKASHTAGSPVKENVQAATCESEGSYEERTYCTKCHALISSKHVTTPKADHQWELLDDSNPTCESNGYTDYVCKVCAAMNTVTKPALGHEYGEEKIERQASMHYTGLIVKRCTRCNDPCYREIPKLTTPIRSEQEVYNILMSFQSKYPDGSPFGYDREYTTNKGDTVTACEAFARELSDAAFGYAPTYEHHDLNDIHVGDLVTSTNHIAVVLKVNEDSVITADGNAGGEARWFNEFPKKYIKSIETRY